MKPSPAVLFWIARSQPDIQQPEEDYKADQFSNPKCDQKTEDWSESSYKISKQEKGEEICKD